MAPGRLLMHVGWTLVCPGAGHGAVGRRRAMAAWATLGLLAALAVTWTVWALVVALAVRVAGALDVLRLRRAEGEDKTLPWIASAFAVAGFLYVQFSTERFAIPSDSMLPRIAVGDSVYASKVLVTPERGEVIVFTHPCEHRTHIKRIVALGGDTVEVRCGKLYVNNEAVADGYAHDFPDLDGALRSCRGGTTGKLVRTKPTATACEPQLVLQIPESTVFVLGDNRAISIDSRVWGVLPVNNIIGRVVGVAWPPAHIGGVQ